MEILMATLERRHSLLTLRQALLIDAVISGLVGVSSFAGARWLDSLLDLPSVLLAGSGAIMVVYAAGLVMLANRERISATGARVVVAGNLVWAAACVALLVGGRIEPNAAGIAFVLVQIVVVIIFAEMQAMALRAGR